MSATPFVQLPPAVQIHVVVAVVAVVIGPIALRVRKGSAVHRGAGYAWAALMLAAAGSSLFIRSVERPNIAGYTPLHVLALVTFVGVTAGIVAAVRRRIALHRRVMWRTYFGGCIAAGLFALAPGRFLHDSVLLPALGWL